MDCIKFLELYHTVGKGHLLQKLSENAKEALAKYVVEFTRSMENFNRLQRPLAQSSSASSLANRQLSKP